MIKEPQPPPTQFIYGPRAMRQDSSGAMRADIIRGLIEAITNSDDAYGSVPGKILIAVSAKDARGHWTVSISDRACGISAADLTRKLVTAGERTSGHEKGEKKRGNRGRGAKDLAIFGGVRFESISGTDAVTLAADRNGAITELRVEKATEAFRKRLGVPKNGTRVVITCRKNITRRQFVVLKRQLQNAVPLRQIMSDQKRTLMLSYPGQPSERLRFVPPKVAETVYSGEIPVAGYGNAWLDLFVATEPFKDGPDLDRLGGLVIQSGRACHESTLFGSENHPYADKLFGSLTFDTIDDLTRELDDLEERNDDPPDANPFPIISRIRDGLEKTHPAYRALRAAVRPIIDEYLRRAAESAGTNALQTRDTERRNDLMARELVKWMIEQEQEIDVELEEPGVLRPAFEIIPSKRVLEQGQRATFNLRARADIIFGNAANVHLEIDEDPVGTLELRPDSVTLTRPSVDAEHYEGALHVCAGRVTGTALISARLLVDGIATGYDSEVVVSVVEPVEIPPLEPPTQFEFASEEYSVQPGKARRLLLMAPDEVVHRIGADVILACSDQAAVVLRGTRVLLEKVPGGWFEADVHVEGLQHGGEGLITATTPSRLEQASTKIVVRDKKGPQLKIVIEPLRGPYRAVWEETKESIIVRVNAVHPAASRYFGSVPQLRLQGRIEARMMVAEAVADVAVQTALKKEADKVPAGLLDIDALQAKRSRKLQELLPRFHRIQISDHEWAVESGGAPEESGAGMGRSGIGAP